ncbi:MAG: RND family transporter [Flavobacteriaceae bacterium]
MLRIFAYKKLILLLFATLTALSIVLLGNLKFSFDFSQFFPEGDEDLIFYQEFMTDFGSDDNFLLVAVENERSVFEQEFLNRFHQFSLAADSLPGVLNATSLTTLSYPLKTSFGYTKLPIIHLDQPDRYPEDWERIKKSDLYLNTMIDAQGTSLVVILTTKNELNYEESVALLEAVDVQLKKHDLTETHIIGRASFYEAIVNMEKREFAITSLAAFLLITIVLFVVYRDFRIVLISLCSVVVGILMFMGVLSVTGQQLNLLSLFYPLLLVIVGTSDVIHIMDGYLREVKKGATKQEALSTTLNGVGISTLLTSLTTAAGFASLLFSKLRFIRDFGLNSAMGVLLMYLTVILFTSCLLLLFNFKNSAKKAYKSRLWDRQLRRVNTFTREHPRLILVASFFTLMFLAYGVSLINTNYQFRSSLPQGTKIAQDFDFFQNRYSGFRPLEVAILTKKDALVTDFEVAKEIEKASSRMLKSQYIKSVQSVNILHKTLNKANHLNKEEFFRLPETKETFEKYRRESQKYVGKRLNAFVSNSKTKGRITAKVLDVGSDSLLKFYADMDKFFKTKTDTNLVAFKLTGKGLLLDKNSVYIRNNLIEGLLFALLLVSALMVALFKNVKLVFISLVPNILPLLFAGALLGYLGISLEATISIVFAIAFGIAVDDTIHFLAKYKLCMQKGLSKEDALKKTFEETGRPLVITTVLLFFGFLVLLFSIHQPSVTIGLMISTTLLAALIFDLLLIPVLIRKLL